MNRTGLRSNGLLDADRNMNPAIRRIESHIRMLDRRTTLAGVRVVANRNIVDFSAPLSRYNGNPDISRRVLDRFLQQSRFVPEADPLEHNSFCSRQIADSLKS